MKKQISFLSKANEIDQYIVESFSADDFYIDIERKKLENEYKGLLEISTDFNRQSVSFQLSKNERLHSWLKYREGFSASLVDTLLNEMKISKNSTILDPFFGSGTTGLVCQIRGINSIGFDILPISKLSITAKQNVFNYDIDELNKLVQQIKLLEVPNDFSGAVNSIPITNYAYPQDTDRFLSYLSSWGEASSFSDITKNLLKLSMVNSLESLSYTTKDGQYLRWDYRSNKVIAANAKKIAQGKKPSSTILDKGKLPFPKEAILGELNSVIDDIIHIQSNVKEESSKANIQFTENSLLKELPLLDSDSIDGVITSPPYCNRYDYTRTYALELAFMGLNNDDVKSLRQSLLSCTVENKSKLTELENYYKYLGKKEYFESLLDNISSIRVLNEVKMALENRAYNGELNNKGILRMVEGYFIELGIVFSELYRICKFGAEVAFVNDNVRYAGEVIPVDFISSKIAESFGFKVKKIYCLKQQKGNSSQQMKKFGRVPLRKSITIWEKR